MDALLVRNSLKMFTAVFITAAIALWSERIEFVWYPLVAVVIVVDDNDDLTVKAATARVMGTVVGGLVTFVVHTILGGWIGVLVSILLMIPVLRLFGWQSGLNTAATLSVMFLMIPRYEALNWDYVFNRGLDTVVGCLVALGVSLLFWPRNSYRELQSLEHRLLGELQEQLHRYAGWLQGECERPTPLSTAPLTSTVDKMSVLVERERRGPRPTLLRSSRWRQRLRLWQIVQFHWIAWERLIEGLPALEVRDAGPIQDSIFGLYGQLQGAGLATARRAPQRWQALALTNGLPLLQLLALEEETRPLHASFGTLARKPC